ncbi:hypothetical protein ACFYVL_35205 [Streptomyces sp. NPDC004111]|uniref:hypothetical protein n=1 Tax=Streptomyces sp. NPDC004111 TaxID=3364690 RepID=UPI0036B56360
MLLASLAVLLCLAGYAALCAVQPFASCRACDGIGVRHVGNRRKAKVCRRCRGSRYRLRAGRRLTNSARRVHTAGTRRPPLNRPAP